MYDNLDQGWALRILIEADAVLVLDWNWEGRDPKSTARALRLPRQRVTEQAEAARHRLDRLHASLVGAIGLDLWAYPARH